MYCALDESALKTRPRADIEYYRDFNWIPKLGVQSLTRLQYQINRSMQLRDNAKKSHFGMLVCLIQFSISNAGKSTREKVA